MSNMPLTTNDQLNILYDLLTEQSEDGCGTPAECQQIARLVQSLQNELADPSVENLQEHLSGISQYSQQNYSDDQLTEHIYSNQANLQQWASAIEQIKDSRFHG
ncbi:YtzH-like family protein [Thalassobacillus devorans]|uniref:YtzH-like family protein n=1 Tax=Thalassobacillus devorans TaxID=279813 RepID=UPI000A1CBB45|nr:YtzH-like family protein [Thalassobacillus devorans]